MNLTLSTNFKNLLCLSFLVLGFLSSAQTKDNTTKTDSTSIIDVGPKGFLAFEMYAPVTSGDNAFAKGISGDIGYNFKLKYQIYKGFFFGASVGRMFLSVNDSEFVGNYSKSRVGNLYMFLGYEYELSKTFNVGASFSLFGDARYRNIVRRSGSGLLSSQTIQKDNSRFTVIETYVDYKITKALALYFNYGYRVDRLEIKTATQIQDDFDNTKYHNFSIGFKFIFGKTSVVDDIFKKKN